LPHIDANKYYYLLEYAVLAPKIIGGMKGIKPNRNFLSVHDRRK